MKNNTKIFLSIILIFLLFKIIDVFGQIEKNSIFIIDQYNEATPESQVYLHYDNLDSLCNDFINTLKTDNNDKIKQYAKRIFINKYYNNLFKKYNFSYRDLPFSNNEELQSHISDEIKLLIKIKDMWKETCNLDSIRLLSIDKSSVDTLDYRNNIKFTEIRMNIKTNIDESLGLGELINVKGKWIVLFNPK